MIELRVNKSFIILIFAILMVLGSVMSVNAVDNVVNVTSNSTYSISVFDEKVAGDVTKNVEIKDNIPRTGLSSEILEKQKQGSTLLHFGNGNGTKLLIWAGIHGNEEEANIATMKLIEHLNTFTKNNTLNGSIYIIPFAIPKDTSINSRDYGPIPYTYTTKTPYKEAYQKPVTTKVKKFYKVRGKRHYKWVSIKTYQKAYRQSYRTVTKTGYKYEDPNKIADQAGSPGWNVIEFAKTHNIKNIIDVHSGGGLNNHPNGIIFTTKDNKDWVSYIKGKTNSVIEYNNGKTGMVRTQGQKNQINTITIEVERDKGSTQQWAEKEFKILLAATQYHHPTLQ